MQHRLTSITLIAAASLILTLPLLHIGVQGHDAVTHMVFSTGFADQLLQGDLLPRWNMEMNAGLGSPAFYYYPSIVYYAGMLFYPLRGLDVLLGFPEGFLPLVATCWLAFALSGITMYGYLQRSYGQNMALLGALFYMTAPYHLVTDLYIRFAFYECWAFIWPPLILLCTDSIMVKRDRRIIPLLALCIGGLTLTHALTMLTFVSLWGIYVLYCCHRQKYYFALIHISVAVLLGISLAAYYLLPAQLFTPYISMWLGKGSYHYSNHFLFNAAWQPNEFYALCLLAIGLYGFARTTLDNHMAALPWLLILLLSILLTTAASEPVWAHISILSHLSFPWRFLTLATLAATLLLVQSRQPKAALLCIGLNIVLSLPAMNMHNPQSAAPYLTHSVLTIDDLRTRWTAQEIFTSGTGMITPDSVRALSDSFAGEKATATNGTVQVKKWENGKIDLHVDSNHATSLRIHQFYFPLWKAYDGNDKPIALLPEPRTGLMTLHLPQGTQQVSMQLEKSAIEWLGIYISLIALMICGWLWDSKRRKA